MLGALAGSVDLTMWDEADYLRWGVQLSGGGLPAAEWGPLYALWYALLARAGASGVRLYDLRYAVLCVLPTLLLYVCGRRYRLPPPLALACALIFLVSRAPHVVPRPSLLALVLSSLIAGSFARTPASASPSSRRDSWSPRSHDRSWSFRQRCWARRCASRFELVALPTGAVLATAPRVAHPDASRGRRPPLRP